METLFPAKELEERMEKLWEDINSGKFSKDLLEEIAKDYPHCKQKIKRFQKSAINRNL